MKEKKTRILIADDHALMRIGLVSLIACEKDLTVVGEAENGEEAVRLVDKLRPDVAVLDLMMPVLSGAEAVRRIREMHPETRTVLLTSYGTSAEMAAAIRNGADAALLKDLPADEFIAALRTVARGGKVIPAEIRRAAEEMSRPLTERQLAILTAMTKGLSHPRSPASSASPSPASRNRPSRSLPKSVPPTVRRPSPLRSPSSW